MFRGIIKKKIERGVLIWQSDYLKEVGCQMQQGFYFSRPIPQEVFENLIEK